MPGIVQSVQFSYAHANGDNLVHITNASRDEKYLCPSCREPMMPVLGNHNARHFRHHRAVCSYESYLHQTAKWAIYNRLRTENTVTLELLREAECKAPKADFLTGFREPCKLHIPAHYNLKALFDQVELEKYDPDTGFTPDVLLTNTSSKAKCYIEINVTHPCSVEKANSKVPILEFHVTSESDITALLTGKLNSEETALTHYNFKPSCRILNSCLDSCQHASVSMEIWNVSPSGRLQKNISTYEKIQHSSDVNPIIAWPKELPTEQQLKRLRGVLQQDDPTRVNANCVSCVYASNWNDGCLNCSKKHLTVPYTEAKLCAQYKYAK